VFAPLLPKHTRGRAIRSYAAPHAETFTQAAYRCYPSRRGYSAIEAVLHVEAVRHVSVTHV
jgi:hypothetical protein